MEIKKPMTVGTLESSDYQVMVEPDNGKVDFLLESAVIHQSGNQIKKVTLGTLEDLDVGSVRVSIVDKGALGCTIKTRTEGTVFRVVDQHDNIPWGGAVRWAARTKSGRAAR